MIVDPVSSRLPPFTWTIYTPAGSMPRSSSKVAVSLQDSCPNSAPDVAYTDTVSPWRGISGSEMPTRLPGNTRILTRAGCDVEIPLMPVTPRISNRPR